MKLIPFNSLDRRVTYTFVFDDDNAIKGVFHEVCPDGTLKVATDNQTYYLNPKCIQYAY